VRKIVLVSMIVLALAVTTPALAQMGSGGGMGAGGMGRGMGPGGGMGARLYNPQTVATVKGPVEKMADLPSMGKGGMGMQYRGVFLKTQEGSLMVHLGPAWFLDEKKFAVKTGETMEVTGSKVTLNSQPAIIAREVTVNGQTLKLRDDQGMPLWRGMGRGPGGGPGMGPGNGPAKTPGAM
jgi:hypothetical protein